MKFDSIICALGARYKSYCSNIVRTLLVDPPEALQKDYEFLLKLEEEILSKLQHGTYRFFFSPFFFFPNFPALFHVLRIVFSFPGATHIGFQSLPFTRCVIGAYDPVRSIA